MRAIRFRGKDALTGAWVYGYYAVLHIARKDNHDTLLGYDEVPSIFNDEPGNRSNGGYWRSVKPDTVGQLTGLKDKNGKEIYEGDVVRDYEGAIHYVQWSVGDGCFDFTGSPYVLSDDCEVIGNIHDKPELLR